MYIYKRQLTREMSWQDDQPAKKLCIQNSISSFEHLSTELIYEILDYLDLSDIFYSFNQLNQYLQNIIFNSSLPLKCQHIQTIQQSFEKLCQQMIIPNRHRIVSLNLSNRFQCMKFFDIYPIDSSFIRLQSLTLQKIKSNDILLLLPRLIHLSKLISLIISLEYILNDPNEIYQQIFQLPMLKYNKLSANRLVLQNTNFIFNHKQISSIEYLIIDHPCTRQSLNEILLCTPKLRHLTCTDLYEIHRNPLINLFHLKSLSIPICYLSFDQFEILIQNFAYHIEILRFQPLSDLNYLDANRWEILIIQSMPKLRRFYLKYSEEIIDDFQCKIYHSNLHRFTSKFWIDKGWIFHIEIDFKYSSPIAINYSIESNQSHQIICQLTITNCHFDNINSSLIQYFQCLSLLAKITHLNIEFQYFSLNILLEFIRLLIHLESICLKFLILNSIESITQQQIQTIYSIGKCNRIINLQTKYLMDFHRLEILLHLCLQLQTLDIECQNENQLQTFIRLILTKKSMSLTCLCFRLCQIDENIIKNLQTSLSQENCTIQQIQNQIFIRW